MAKKRFVTPPALPEEFLRQLDASWWHGVAANPKLRLWLELHARPGHRADSFRFDRDDSEHKDSEDSED